MFPDFEDLPAFPWQTRSNWQQEKYCWYNKSWKVYLRHDADFWNPPHLADLQVSLQRKNKLNSSAWKKDDISFSAFFILILCIKWGIFGNLVSWPQPTLYIPTPFSTYRNSHGSGHREPRHQQNAYSSADVPQRKEDLTPLIYWGGSNAIMKSFEVLPSTFECILESRLIQSNYRRPIHSITIWGLEKNCNWPQKRNLVFTYSICMLDPTNHYINHPLHNKSPIFIMLIRPTMEKRLCGIMYRFALL